MVCTDDIEKAIVFLMPLLGKYFTEEEIRDAVENVKTLEPVHSWGGEGLKVKRIPLINEETPN